MQERDGRGSRPRITQCKYTLRLTKRARPGGGALRYVCVYGTEAGVENDFAPERRPSLALLRVHLDVVV